MARSESIAASLRLPILSRTRRWLLERKHDFGPRNRELAVNRQGSYAPSEIRRLNWERRVKLIQHCATYVPYYRKLFERIGFHPSDLTDESVFSQLPILDKNSIRERPEEFIAENLSPQFRRAAATGGSTGEPLKVYLDARFPSHALSCRMLHWWGVDPSDNSGYLYRAVPEGIKRVLTSLAIYPTRRTYIHSADMTRERMRSFYERLLRLRVTYLVGYVGAVDSFGQYLAAERLTIPSLKAVWTTASPLPRFKQRLLDSVFGCPVYTQYGCVEIPYLAAECQYRCGLHVFSDIRHIEVVTEAELDTHGDDVGDVVITDLTNYVFPLLRYRVGDRGRLLARQCSCEQPYPLMDYVQGRTTDSIYLPDGSAIPGEYWTTIFDDWPSAIKAFQVHQHADYTVEIRFEAAGPAWEDAVADVSRVLKARTQHQLRLEFRSVPVAINENGKTRYVTSEVQQNGQVQNGLL